MSHQLASDKGEDEYAISHARLVQVESGESTPSIYKLFSLSVIYATSITKLLSLYITLDGIGPYHFISRRKTTQLIDDDIVEGDETIKVPMALRQQASAQQTGMLSEMVAVWGTVPASLLRHLDLQRCQYGFIGLSDYMMFPLLRPGSFVQIAKQHRPDRRHRYQSEFERPLYFIESRQGYFCCWCELRGTRLLAIPHPLSPCSTKEFRYPDDAQILGRVVAVAARLTTPMPPTESPAIGEAPQCPPAVHAERETEAWA